MMNKQALPVLLLVEDVHELRGSFKHTLRDQGFHVLEAEDDDEAIEYAEHERIDANQ